MRRILFSAGLICLMSIPARPQQNPPAQAPPKASAGAPAAVLRARQAEPQVEEPAQANSEKLPVRRVVLYKNGIGYFEHLGRVRGNQALSIDFTSGQLNDVLSSLTVLDLGGGKITAVNYNSEAPLAKRLGALRLPLGEQTTVSQFLGALRGARLEVHSAEGTVTGRLLAVERKTRTTKEGQVLQYDEISLVTDAGEVRTADLGTATTVRLLEHDLNQDVGRYLNLIASTRSQDLRRMTISTAGAGERQVYVSYISEVPLWKTTYRIVMPSKANAKPLLQGWAIVDNTVGEDWDDVELSLVAGAPQSFIQQLSQPYYSRRPVVPLPESVQLEPQTHAATLIPGNGTLTGTVTDPSGAAVAGATVQVYDANGNLAGTATTDPSGNYSVRNLPDGSYRLEAQLQGFRKEVMNGVLVAGGAESSQDVELNLGSASEVVEVTAGSTAGAVELDSLAAARARNPATFAMLQPGVARKSWLAAPSPATLNASRAAQQAAQGQELGDLFEYKLKQPVTIRKNQSALVPILQSDVTAEKVSLWNESAGRPQPLLAIWLTNSSGLTLDGGSFSVLEEETFAGEGLTDPIKPGEKRLLSYAADLGVRVEARAQSESQPVTHVRIFHGVMIQTSEVREQKTYTIRNEDTHARVVVIEHPHRAEFKLAEGLEPAETTAGMYRFRVSVDAKKTATFTVKESRPVETRYTISNITPDQITVFVRQKTINPEIEQALRRIVAQKGTIAGLDAQLQARKDETKRIFDDQQRLRENMKALKGSAEEKALLQRYTKQLDDEETRLDAIRKESADLESKRAEAQAELSRMIEALEFDAAV